MKERKKKRKEKKKENKRNEKKREKGKELRHLNFFVGDSAKWGERVQGGLALLQLHFFPQKK